MNLNLSGLNLADGEVFHVEVELEMTWTSCIKRLEVSGMTWL